MKLSQLMLVIILSVLFGGAPASAANKSIYIDSLSDEKEYGSINGEQYRAKDVVADWSKMLDASLEVKNIAVHLFSDKDHVLSADMRLAEARKNAADAYLALKISRQSNNCVNLLVLKINQSRIEKRDPNISSIIDDLNYAYKIAESEQIAHAIRGTLNKLMPTLCVRVNAVSHTLLEKSDCPIVIIDFGIVDSQAHKPYIHNTALMNQIIAAIAEGIAEHFASGTP